MFVALIGALGWVTSEVVRRSDPRRLEQFASVIDHVSAESTQRAELQTEIDRLALRVTLRRRRPACSLIRAVGLIAAVFTLFVFANVILDLILSILDPRHLAQDLTWQFWIGYVLTLTAMLSRWMIRSSWFDSEYRRISCEPVTATRSWRRLFTI
jgi:hypothetical protein